LASGASPGLTAGVTLRGAALGADADVVPALPTPADGDLAGRLLSFSASFLGCTLAWSASA
jgi:hypothetical protein